MFGNFNFADIGKHADELKALVTGLLNSTQATGEKAERALDAVSNLAALVQALIGTVTVLHSKVETLSSDNAVLLAHTHSSDEIIPADSIITAEKVAAMTESEKSALCVELANPAT